MPPICPARQQWLLQDNSGNVGSIDFEFLRHLSQIERSNFCTSFSICHLYLSNQDCGRARARKAHKQAWLTSSVELVPAQGKQRHNAGGLPHHCYPLPHRSSPPETSKKNLNKLCLGVSCNLDVNIGGSSPLSTLLGNGLKIQCKVFSKSSAGIETWLCKTLCSCGLSSVWIRTP